MKSKEMKPTEGTEAELISVCHTYPIHWDDCALPIFVLQRLRVQLENRSYPWDRNTLQRKQLAWKASASEQSTITFTLLFLFHSKTHTPRFPWFQGNQVLDIVQFSEQGWWGFIHMKNPATREQCLLNDKGNLREHNQCLNWLRNPGKLSSFN